jgi:hypothetical protein
MRSVRFFLAGLGLLVFLGSAAPQEKKGKNEKTAKEDADPAAVEVRFADGSVVKMVLLTETIEVGTRYGKLKVAANEIRRIEFGLRIPEATLKRIDAAIADLGSPEFPKREAAGKELLALKELAYPAVQGAAKSSDAEVARRAQAVLKTMTERTPVEKLRFKKHDTIVTTEFPIIGQIEAANLKAKTPYFGEVELQLAELRAMRWIGFEREVKVVVDAAKFGGQQEAWLDTGIEINAEVGLEVTASGTVDLSAPGEAGTNVATPAGIRGALAGGGGRGGGFAAGPGAGGLGGGRSAVGALVGRIGERGRMFLVGTKFDGVPSEDGRLYLRIMPGPWNNEPTGTYDVRINVGGSGGR